MHTVRGMAIKFWTRSKFKRANALKRKVNPTRVPIETKEPEAVYPPAGEPSRCIHIGDRESDIYELFYAHEASTPPGRERIDGS